MDSRNAAASDHTPDGDSSRSTPQDKDKAKLKDYLRIAEKYRKEGKELAKQGDLEAAFVLLAKAATLVLEKLPKHRDYYTLLNDEQQNNLALVCILSPPPQSIHRCH